MSAEAVRLELTSRVATTCFQDRLLIRPDGFRKAAEAGIDPASRRLTVAFPYQHRTHRINQSGRLDSNHGHRPTRMSVGRSCSRGTRNGQAFPRPEKCAQSESNRGTDRAWMPGLVSLHGKQEGCHYIMGAKQCDPSCQRSSEHRARLGCCANS